MKRMVKRKPYAEQGRLQSAFWAISACFLLGGIVGIVLANLVSGSGEEALVSYIKGFLSAVEGGSAKGPGFFLTAWSVLRWPILALLLSLSAVGLVGIPILFLARGFLFSFFVAAFVRVFGYSGAMLCLLLIGAESLLSIPVLFILGAQGILLAAKGKPKGRLQEGRGHYFSKEGPFGGINIICGFLLLICILWEAAVVPNLLMQMSGLVF